MILPIRAPVPYKIRIDHQNHRKTLPGSSLELQMHLEGLVTKQNAVDKVIKCLSSTPQLRSCPSTTEGLSGL